MNLAQLLVRSAAAHPERVAVRFDAAALTYALLDAATRRVAGYLTGDGVGPGDRVALMLPNVAYWPVLYYGILRAGAIAVPLSPSLSDREIKHVLRDSGARQALVWHGCRGEALAAVRHVTAATVTVDPDTFPDLVFAAAPVAGVVDRDLDDTAVLLYTSGTAGEPRGAALTHGNLARAARLVADDLLHLSPDDVVFGGLPLCHVFGQTCALNATVAAGATLSLVARFEPTAALTLLEQDRVSVFPGVPTMYGALVNHPHRERFDVSALRVGVSGGAAMPGALLREFEAAFGAVVLEGYGLSETSAAVTCNRLEDRRPGSVGVPVPGVELRVVDTGGSDVATGELGEIAVRGDTVMKGYWGSPHATPAATPDGWFRSGDIGRLDQEGHLYVVDRVDEVIVRDGRPVYPSEVEQALRGHAAVAEAAVIGIPDRELGEEVAAVVALKPGATATAEEIVAYARSELAAHQWPRVLQVTAALPKGPTGRVRKREIVLEAVPLDV